MAHVIRAFPSSASPALPTGLRLDDRNRLDWCPRCGTSVRWTGYHWEHVTESDPCTAGLISCKTDPPAPAPAAPVLARCATPRRVAVMGAPGIGRLAGAVSCVLAVAVIVSALASALGGAVVVGAMADALVAVVGWMAWRLGRRSVVRAER